MKTSSILKKYSRKRRDALLELLTKEVSEFTLADFHTFRVEIKKLRTLFALLQFSFKKCKKQAFIKPYAKLFRQAGKVRELQLDLLMLKKYDLLETMPVYAGDLLERFEFEHQRFFALINKKLWRKMELNDKTFRPFLEKMKKGLIDDYLQRIRRKIDKLIQAGHLQAKHVHRLRKRYKQYCYIDRSFTQHQTDHQTMDAFQELLGQWHDRVVMSNYLQKAIDSERIPSEEMHAATSLKSRIDSESDKMLLEINGSPFRQEWMTVRR